jgi:signal transduction histidine kinase
MRARQHSLRGRIVLTIIGSVIATSLIFGLAAFGIAYTTEDRLFRRALADEVAYQKSSWQRTGVLATPNNPDVSIYRGNEPLPQEIRKEFAENRRQSEFYGREGRHYHIQRFDVNDGRSGAGPEPAVAVIEVSRDLLVRPVRDEIIALLVGISLFIATLMGVFGSWLVNRAMKPLSDGFVDRERTFTRDASHELRTPLAVVRGAAEVIALNRDVPPNFTKPLRRIEMATTDMALALDQLLALARESEGVLKESVALHPMIDKAVSWAKVRYPNSLIAVSTKVDNDAAVFVHPTSLQLVLNNLVGNCFQHVGNGRLVIDFDSSCLSISDDGPGFQADTDPFTPFEKGNDSNGSGLGLDISRRLCAAAGIGLTAGGSKVRRGARFRLEFCVP